MDTTFKVKRSKVKVTRPLYSLRRFNASGSCSGERWNILAEGTYCYVAVCTLQARSARRREALRCPQREERAGHIVAAARRLQPTAARRTGRFSKMHGLCAHSLICHSTMPVHELSSNDSNSPNLNLCRYHSEVRCTNLKASSEAKNSF